MEEYNFIYEEKYVDYDEYIDLLVSLNRYNKITHDDLLEKTIEILKGNLLGKKKDNKYILPLKTEPVFKKLIGPIKLVYSVDEENKIVTNETIEPYNILINHEQQELLSYNKKSKEYTFYNDLGKFCKIINTYSKNGRHLLIYTDYTYKKNNKLNVYYGKYDQKEKDIKFKKLDKKEDRFLKEEIKILKNEIEKELLFLNETINSYNNSKELTPKQIEILKNNNITI